MLLNALTTVAAAAVLAAPQAATPPADPGQQVTLTYIPSGATAKLGGYRPQRMTLTGEKPAALTKAPADLKAPLYGTFVLGRDVLVIVDEPAEGDARLFVDANGNGDLTDDPTAEWHGTPDSRPQVAPDQKKIVRRSGHADVQVGTAPNQRAARIAFYRFDKDDPTRQSFRDVLFYYGDYMCEGELELAGKKYMARLTDPETKGVFQTSTAHLMLDVNGNGKYDSRGEAFVAREPFNVNGVTWELVDIAPDGQQLRVRKSSTSVPAVPTPPQHELGRSITSFSAVDTAGKTVNFPADYKGKIVLLDFWATWCGPCMAEMPNVVSAYEKWHSKGFEVLGVSLDNQESVKRMQEVMTRFKMTWPQIADGGGWKAKIAVDYAINSIPATYLVDGTTGKILGVKLRGKALDTALEKALSGAAPADPAAPAAKDPAAKDPAIKDPATKG